MATSDNANAPDRSPPAVFHHVRDEDHAILHAVRDGDDTVRKLNDRLTLTRRQINYALDEKLDPLGLLVVTQRDGYTTSVVNGQKHRHRKSKQATLTETGMQYFDWQSRAPDLGQFDKAQAATHAEKVAQLEAELEQVKAELDKHKQALQQLHHSQQAASADD